MKALEQVSAAAMHDTKQASTSEKSADCKKGAAFGRASLCRHTLGRYSGIPYNGEEMADESFKMFWNVIETEQ